MYHGYVIIIPETGIMQLGNEMTRGNILTKCT